VITPADVLARVRALPTLSASALRVGALSRDARSGAGDFEQAIRPDPALTANLLRIANSAYIGLRCEADSVRQAVAMLGVKRTSELAAAAALAPAIPQRVPGYEMTAADFWLHSIAVAVLAERMALELDLAARESIFTAGLLHDVGKLAAGSFVAEVSGPILSRSRSGVALVVAEREVLGIDHAEVGAAVAEAWRLPPAAALAARWHHAPGEAPQEAERTVVDLVHLADALAHALGLGGDVGELARTVDRGAEERSGLRLRILERVAAESLEEIRELGSLFSSEKGMSR
jgi:putative nucleotidyltransferase with HDIG domain